MFVPAPLPCHGRSLGVYFSCEVSGRQICGTIVQGTAPEGAAFKVELSHPLPRNGLAEERGQSGAGEAESAKLEDAGEGVRLDLLERRVAVQPNLHEVEVVVERGGLNLPQLRTAGDPNLPQQL